MWFQPCYSSSLGAGRTCCIPSSELNKGAGKGGGGTGIFPRLAGIRPVSEPISEDNGAATGPETNCGTVLEDASGWASSTTCEFALAILLIASEGRDGIEVGGGHAE